jgi:hypothetical protein
LQYVVSSIHHSGERSNIRISVFFGHFGWSCRRCIWDFFRATLSLPGSLSQRRIPIMRSIFHTLHRPLPLLPRLLHSRCGSRRAANEVAVLPQGKKVRGGGSEQ